MASFEFDNVKAEKEDALWRYNMEMKRRMVFRLVGLCLGFFLSSWSLFPTLIPDTVEAAGGFRRRFVSAFNKPLFTFIVVNIIILVIYFLSNQKQIQKQANPDVYDEYVSSRRSGIPNSAVETAVSNSLVAEETVVDKQIVLVENAVVVSPVEQQPRTTVDFVTETKRSISPVEKPKMIRTEVSNTKPSLPVPSVNEVKTKEYRRTRSMVSESRYRRPKEFWRSETTIGRELVVSGGEPPRKSIDEVSNEEFRSIIDSFIAEKKKTLMQENTAHFTRTKHKCMSIVVKNLGD